MINGKIFISAFIMRPMYQNSPIDPITPDSKDYYLFEMCDVLRELSTCNKRQVGAGLQLTNGMVFEGSNGSKEESCKAKGSEYCTRDKSVGVLEYLTCPSLCAEGEPMLDAYILQQDLKNARLFTTGFPCQRCKDLIIHFEIGEVYFGAYKEGSPRMYEDLYAAEMTSRGIKVFEWVKTEAEYILKELVFNREFETFARNAMITPGDAWLRLIFDERYRKNIRAILEDFKDRIEPVPENFNELNVRAIL